jgi:hypothetical protein
LLSQHKGGTLSYYLLDGQGSVRGLTSTSGTLTAADSYTYDAFGQLTSGQTNHASSYLYIGWWWPKAKLNLKLKLSKCSKIMLAMGCGG